MKGSEKTILALLLILMIFTGYLRDFLFININEQIRVTYYKAEESFLHPSLKSLESFSYKQLYYGKWMLTLLFALIFLGFSCLIVRHLFSEKIFIRRTILMYVVIFSLSFLFFGFGYLSNHSEKGYRFARLLMGLVQSPLILMVLIPSFYLLKKDEDS